MQQYDRGVLLPVGVQSALNEDFTIAHKGLLCWVEKPGPMLMLILRSIVLVMETAFAFALVLWAMRSRTKDYGMPRLCPWGIDRLGYDG